VTRRGVASILIAAVLVVPLGGQSPAPIDRVARVERWLSAVVHHRIGTLDAAAMEVAAWPNAQLSVLWDDLNALTLLMRHPDQQIIWVPLQTRRPEPVYPKPQALRLMVLACASAGIAETDRACLKNDVTASFDNDLRMLERAAVDGRGAGADNFVLKYGALLETDIALLAPASVSSVTRASGGGAHRFRVELTDGEAMNPHQSAVHWEIARMLLDAVRSSRTEPPAPARDAMVREWYIATARWMQFNVHYDLTHLDRARALFPDDREILFLSGTQHAIYATPRIQHALKSLVLPPGYAMDAKADVAELRQARTLLRRAVEVDPSFAEARLRLGRVLALEGQFAEANRELTVAERSATDETNRYYAALFLGAVHEATGRFDEARAAYERAGELFPLAQSPLAALAALARRRGDRPGALRAMQELVALPPNPELRKDPWWIYDIWHGRDADDRIDAVRRLFARESP